MRCRLRGIYADARLWHCRGVVLTLSNLKTRRRSFRLRAPEGLGARPRPGLIGPVLTSLQATLQDAVRMGFLHSSRARGRVSHSLKAAADVRFVGHEADGDAATLLHFEVPTFGSVAEEMFCQKLLWEDGPQPEQTAFELLGAALADVSARRKESNRYDPGLLRRIATYRRPLSHGLTEISLPDAELPQVTGIDSRVIIAAGELAAATPGARRVRVAGRLDLMGASQGVLKVEVAPGAIVTALWEGPEEVDALREFFNRDVVVEGTGIFRPSGVLLRIDADAIRAAGSQDSFFREVPVAAASVAEGRRLRVGERSAYARILGSIPAEESDEDFAAAVEALS